RSQPMNAPLHQPLFLPRFSLAAEVDEFIEMLARFERGELSPDAWRKFRLLRGTYGQRQDEVQMIRIKIPLGYLTAPQARVIADVAERHAHGLAHLTTRQNFQFHFVQLAEVPALLRALEEVGITTREACGNSVRNVTMSELSGVDPHQIFDVRPHGETLVRFFLRHPKSSDLPRKFKIALSCSPRDCAQAAIHDIGLIAAKRDGARGFRVLVGGGLSTSPQNAALLYEFLPEAELLEVAEAILLLFDARGNRSNKHRARLKYVLRDLGIDGLRTAVEELRVTIRARGDAPPVFQATPEPPPPPADRATPAEAAPGYLTWRASNARAQLQPGYFAVYIRLPLGDITSVQLRAVADASERFANGAVWTSSDQNLLLRFVPVGDLKALHAALVAAGLAADGAGTLRDITSCPGADSCNLAVTTSRGLGRAISNALEGALAAGGALAQAVELARDATIKISGCPHSCGRHHIADLGFHGAARKIGGKAMPVYQLHLGGRVDGNGAVFGEQVVKIPAKRVPSAVLLLVEHFAVERQGEETFAAYLRRLPADRLKALLATHTSIEPADAKDDEFLDFDAQHGFVVETKAGECAA
ncbi:MAG: nitrite/sulfite reductase, partial [Myxococcales bacterium]|nr:nitrite/sulfite reductase [Polyangiaceae bacterium]MDW8251962.1 nitrite/sulfite reductase [Myxococcales bacterium]